MATPSWAAMKSSISLAELTAAQSGIGKFKAPKRSRMCSLFWANARAFDEYEPAGNRRHQPGSSRERLHTTQKPLELMLALVEDFTDPGDLVLDRQGDIDLADLRAKADEHAHDLAALMVTYPSTHGVFEPTIREICDIVHAHGGGFVLNDVDVHDVRGVVWNALNNVDASRDLDALAAGVEEVVPVGGGGDGVAQ